MNNKRSYYLLKIQFLGFRYSGWQRQPGQKTVEGMLLKTLRFILPDQGVKILGSSRTDAKVSALNFAFELFLEGNPINNLADFVILFNKNLPPDIKVLEINEVDASFNVIKDVANKEYHYLFSKGVKNHPFCAPFMANFQEQLNIERMQEAASLFEGTHDFAAYTSRLRDRTNTVREVEQCIIEPNTVLTANFFPEESFVLRIRANGFMRYQVRMIMGALVTLGKGTWNYDDIRESLRPGTKMQVTYVAPGSGLHLNNFQFRKTP